MTLHNDTVMSFAISAAPWQVPDALQTKLSLTSPSVQAVKHPLFPNPKPQL
jgi:hypothetical protein